MTLLDTVNIGGLNYGLNSKVPMGTCATPAGSEVKECLFADNFQLSAGNLIAVTFTYANTYGDGSTTYPKLSVQGTQYPVKYCTGEYASNGAWANGEAVTFMFDGTNFIRTLLPVTDTVEANNMHAVTSNAVSGAIGSIEIINDANNALPANEKEKTYYIYANSANLPTSGYNFVIVTYNGRTSTSSDYRLVVQMAYATGNANYGATYTRIGLSNDNGATWTWKNWDKVITGTDLGISYNDDGNTDITSQVTAYLGATSVTACRKNNIVFMSITGVFSGNATNTTQKLLEDLPSKYIPRNTQYCAVIAYSSSSPFVYPARLQVVADTGVVNLSESGIPSGSQMRFGIIYMI